MGTVSGVTDDMRIYTALLKHSKGVNLEWKYYSILGNSKWGSKNTEPQLLSTQTRQTRTIFYHFLLASHSPSRVCRAIQNISLPKYFFLTNFPQIYFLWSSHQHCCSWLAQSCCTEILYFPSSPFHTANKNNLSFQKSLALKIKIHFFSAFVD